MYLEAVEDSISISVAIGRRAREIRLERGQTLDAVATGMRQLGFKWTTSRVVDLENGKVAPTLGNLLALCSTFSLIGSGSDGAEHRVALRDLVPKIGRVEIAPGYVVSAEQLRAAIDGRAALISEVVSNRLSRDLEQIDAALERANRLRGPRWSWKRGVQLETSATLADARAAATLSITLPELITAAQALWDDNLSGERDRRSAPGDSAQRRGRITRELLQEVTDYIALIDTSPSESDGTH